MNKQIQINVPHCTKENFILELQLYVDYIKEITCNGKEDGSVKEYIECFESYIERVKNSSVDKYGNMIVLLNGASKPSYLYHNKNKVNLSICVCGRYYIERKKHHQCRICVDDTRITGKREYDRKHRSGKIYITKLGTIDTYQEVKLLKILNRPSKERRIEKLPNKSFTKDNEADW